MTSPMHRFGFAVFVSCTLFGCPKDEANADGDAAVERSAQSPCAAWTGWETRCAGQPDFAAELGWGTDGCPSQVAWSYVQPQFVNAVSQCLGTLACDASDDDCTYKGYEAVGLVGNSAVLQDPLYQRCVQRFDECTDLNSDVCEVFFLFTSSGRSAAEPCLDLPCADLQACIGNPDAY
jgi:hypothetical protein